MPPKKEVKEKEKKTTVTSKSKSIKTAATKLNKEDESVLNRPGTKDRATTKDKPKPKPKPKAKSKSKAKGKTNDKTKENDETDIQIINVDNNEDINTNNFEIKSDYRNIIANYDPNKNMSSNKLSIYESTMIIAKRKTQLAYNVEPLVEYSEHDKIEDIVVRELKEKKIPFMVKRTIGDALEYWRIEDMVIDEELFSILH